MSDETPLQDVKITIGGETVEGYAEDDGIEYVAPVETRDKVWFATREEIDAWRKKYHHELEDAWKKFLSESAFFQRQGFGASPRAKELWISGVWLGGFLRSAGIEESRVENAGFNHGIRGGDPRVDPFDVAVRIANAELDRHKKDEEE